LNRLLALYLHIPFCQRKCPYCDFNSYAGQERHYTDFVQALAVDLARAGQTRPQVTVPSVFLGGGTPTVLSPAHLQTLFAALHASFTLATDAEITSEANPGTVDQNRFQTLRALGVNRLSMGVQSFDDAELRFLGRIHSAQQAIDAFRLARQAGFDNINLDFIFGLPQQSPDSWRRSLRQAIALQPEHLSLYSLIVEPDTPLAHRVATGQVSAPDDDGAADLYEIAADMLGAAGYHAYEISNWARGPLTAEGLPRFACRHNLVYWHNAPYLGLGPGAHSSEANRRWSVLRNVGAYIQAVQQNTNTSDMSEDIPPRLAMGETMMLGLRLVEVGVRYDTFGQRFGQDLRTVFAAELAELQGRGLIEVGAERVRLHPQARLLGNEAFAAFLPD